MKFGKMFGVALFATALIAALSACEKPEGTAEQAGKAVDNAVERAAKDIDNAAAKAGEKVEQAGKRMQDAAEDGKK